MKHALTLGFLFLISSSLSGCGPKFEEAAPIEDVQIYEGGLGVVTEIVADGNMAVIRHEEIPGFMMAMTMTFGIRSDSVRNAFSQGDSIRFDVAFDGIDSWLSRVERIED